MAQGETWTVGRLLEWTAPFLSKHGSESPRLDAEILLAESLGCRRIELYTAYDREPNEDTRTRFRDLVRRRAEGMPVAYLVGRREFYSLSFKVTPAVLIPRPETEFVLVALVDLVEQRPADAPLRICDVGTGSGALAVAAARHFPAARITALDLSAAALDVARQNAADHGVAERVALLESDLFAELPAAEQFDFVLSNPPYVREDEFADLAREVRDFEPRTALVAGPRGTEVIERLAAEAIDRVVPGGCLLIEIGPAIHDAARAVVAAAGPWEILPTVKDLARLPRVIQARRQAR